MQAHVLAPAAILVLWSLVMLVWVGRTRFGAMEKAGISLSKARPGGRGQDLEGVLPPEVNWKAHNYAHLMEQPTLFYATLAIIAILGGQWFDVALAWAYVAIRIVHSVYQATVNRVPVRLRLFKLSTLCLAILALRAAQLALFGEF